MTTNPIIKRRNINTTRRNLIERYNKQHIIY